MAPFFAVTPDHYKNYTLVGVMLMGLGGGVTRDVLVNQVPAALKNPAYLTMCVIAGAAGYCLAYARGQLFREGLFQFMTSFSCRCMRSSGPRKASAPSYLSPVCWSSR
jgi:uncharacterized membrane protein YeiH